MRSILCVMVAMVSMTGCNADAEVDDGPLRSLTANDLMALEQTLWKDPSNIQVCWETPESYGSNDFDSDVYFSAKEKEWVRQAIADSWSAANPRIRFIGWGDCGENSPGIRIKGDSKTNGHVLNFGRFLDGVRGGVVLNFDFEKRRSAGSYMDVIGPCLSSEDGRKACIEGLAVHEFGHALGVIHEHERSDLNAEAWCADRVQSGNAGGLAFGDYDPLSIMNYCRKDSLVNWPLSYMDRQGILALYPPSGGGPRISGANFDWGRPTVYAYWDENDGSLVAGTASRLTIRFFDVDGVLALQNDLSDSRDLNMPVEFVYADGSRRELPMDRGRWSVTESSRWPGKYDVKGETLSFTPMVEGGMAVYWNGRYSAYYSVAARRR